MTTTRDTINKLITLLAVLLVFIHARYCTTITEQAQIRNGEAAADTLVLPDLEQIKKRGRLVAITDNSSTSYFVYKGEPMGYEYELLSRYAKHLGVDLEVRIAPDLNYILEQLNDGEADIAAANLTVTRERAEVVNFSSPLLFTKQVLVQRTPGKGKKNSREKLVRSPAELIGKKVHVRKGSSFYQRLKNLSEESGGEIRIVEVPGSWETEELIEMVSRGEIDFTVADENVALVNQTYHTNIDVKTELSLPQQIAWAVRKDSPQLLHDIDCWLESNRKSAVFALTYRKYFVDRRAAGQRMESPYYSGKGDRISVYDHAIKTYSHRIGWDWRLLASLIYQESRFNPEARSWAGAYGLMQLIPATSARYGIDSLTATPVQSIEAGTRYIASLERYWKKQVRDSSERIRFILASYNVGPGHVIDARNLAIRHGYDPNRWDDNVETCLLLKSKPQYYLDKTVKHGYCRGQEPCQYVKQVLERYRHYTNVIPGNPYLAGLTAIK